MEIILAILFILLIKAMTKGPKKEVVPAYARAGWIALCQMSPHGFEEHCASWLEKQGYVCELTGRGGDGNIDILVKNGTGGLIGIAECKHHNKPIGAAALKVLHATMLQNGVRTGWFFSLQGFSPGALMYHKTIPSYMRLIDGKEMVRN